MIVFFSRSYAIHIADFSDGFGKQLLGINNQWVWIVVTEKCNKVSSQGRHVV